jgi:hypothetical protein
MEEKQNSETPFVQPMVRLLKPEDPVGGNKVEPNDVCTSGREEDNEHVSYLLLLIVPRKHVWYSSIVE